MCALDFDGNLDGNNNIDRLVGNMQRLPQQFCRPCARDVGAAQSLDAARLPSSSKPMKPRRTPPPPPPPPARRGPSMAGSAGSATPRTRTSPPTSQSPKTTSSGPARRGSDEPLWPPPPPPRRQSRRRSSAASSAGSSLSQRSSPSLHSPSPSPPQSKAKAIARDDPPTLPLVTKERSDKGKGVINDRGHNGKRNGNPDPPSPSVATSSSAQASILRKSSYGTTPVANVDGGARFRRSLSVGGNTNMASASRVDLAYSQVCQYLEQSARRREMDNGKGGGVRLAHSDSFAHLPSLKPESAKRDGRSRSSPSSSLKEIKPYHHPPTAQNAPNGAATPLSVIYPPPPPRKGNNSERNSQGKYTRQNSCPQSYREPNGRVSPPSVARSKSSAPPSQAVVGNAKPLRRRNSTNTAADSDDGGRLKSKEHARSSSSSNTGARGNGAVKFSPPGPVTRRRSNSGGQPRRREEGLSSSMSRIQSDARDLDSRRELVSSTTNVLSGGARLHSEVRQFSDFSSSVPEFRSSRAASAGSHPAQQQRHRRAGSGTASPSMETRTRKKYQPGDECRRDGETTASPSMDNATKRTSVSAPTGGRLHTPAPSAGTSGRRRGSLLQGRRPSPSSLSRSATQALLDMSV